MKQTIMKLLLGIYFLFLVGLVSTSPPIPKHSFEKRVLKSQMVVTRKCLCRLCRGPIHLRSGEKRQEGSSFLVMGAKSLTTTFQCVPPAANRPLSPLYSTRQRLESDNLGLSFSDVSPIRLANQVSSTTTDNNGKHF